MTYCHDCDRSFRSRFALKQHLLNSGNHNYCDSCEVDFSTWIGLKEHWVQSPNHDYCQYCNEHYATEWDLRDHYEGEHAFCGECNRVFKNDNGLHEHYRQSPLHCDCYCISCKRLFNSENSLRNHLRSSIHQPKNVVCPGHGCGMAFVSTSALVLHLEAGRCPSGLTRTSVNKIVRNYDRNNIITDPARMIGGGYGDSDEEVTFYASGAAWNGSGYKCYLCDNEYRTLASLNQHLGSPRHQAKIYICPWTSCRERFTTLSGFCQHVESGRCDVLRSNPHAKRIIEGAVRNMRTITY